MNTPNETPGIDIGVWGGMLAVLGFVCKRWLVKLNPFVLLQMGAVWLNEPLMRKHVGPVMEEQKRQGEILERACRVIDKLPGADAAHDAVRAEDAIESRWER